jgi:hypothetical protein
MFLKMEKYLVKIKRSAGLEVILNENNRFTVNGTVVTTQQNSIVKEIEFTGVEDLNALEKKISKSLPLHIVFNGQGVLLKKTTKSNKREAFQEILAGSNPTEFYSELYLTHINNYIFITRKQKIDNILNLFIESGYKVIAISLGFSVVDYTLPFIKSNEPDFSLSCNCFKLNICEEELKGFENIKHNPEEKYQPLEYLIANQYVKSSNVLSFSAATSTIAEVLNGDPQIESNLLKVSINEFKYRKIYHFAGYALLFLFLMAFSINFILYSHYSKKNSELTESASANSIESAQIKILERKINEKIKLLGKTKWLESSKTSYYADRIAGLVPYNMKLTSMEIFPFSTRFEIGNRLNFKNDTILVSGICNNPVDLTNFQDGLKVLKDFKSIDIKSYQFKNENNEGSFVMEIATK